MNATRALYLFFVIVSVSFAACNQEGRTQLGGADRADTTAVDGTASSPSVPEQSENRDSINLQLVNGEATQEATMEKGKHVVFVFHVEKAGQLSASVKPGEANGNVRIAQIFLPNNEADGPFGPTMEYKLNEPGIYRIVVSENQMAGDPYNGPFTFSLKVGPQ
ncbi:hypothetical protein [Olivibacter sp. XZL3]|uniref:hypothetical protein n=1 Tax=Olivibacter sp. XZL3 TaxID=1735116 RepID=UPI001064F010|nr:hypothetical protein [Olivibacter sp. XZL3]